MADLINNTIGENYNHFINGMDLDTNDVFMSKDTYRYAENIRIICDKNSTNGVIQSVSDKTNLYGNYVYCSNLVYVLNDNFTPTWTTINYTLTNLTLPNNCGIVVGTKDIRDYTVIFTFNPTTSSSFNSGILHIFKLYKINNIFTLKEIVNTTLLLNNTIDNINNFSIVARYEDYDNIKVYWTDGYNLIRVVNIADKYDNRNISITDIRELNIDPLVSFNAPEFIGLGTGSLKTGKIQYCYQLFDVNGCETELSPCTNLIHLTDSNNTVDTSSKYKGSYYNENTNKSVKLKITLANTNFERLKLVSILYSSETNTPTINMVGDYNIKGLSEIYVEDTGSTVLSELTLAEFNLIKGTYIIPRILESKYNYLFAANIKYNDLSVDYDARSYRFAPIYDHSSKKLYFYLKLLSINTNTTINQVFTYDDMIGNTTTLDTYLSTISSEHDCINEYNDVTKEDWEFSESIEFDSTSINYSNISNAKFNKGIIKLDNRYTDGEYLIDGGRGLNVDYEFITSLISLDDSKVSNTPTTTIDDLTWFTTTNNKDVNTNVTKKTIDGFHQKTVGKKYTNNVLSDIVNSDFYTINSTSDFTDYSGVVVDYYMRSLHRDEIYRYGCRLYDEYGRKSDVKWIGDIRTPSLNELGYDAYMNDALLSFKEDLSDSYIAMLVGKPLGLRFFFRNLPTNVKAVEIVRVKRTPDNSSILAQGLIYKEYDIVGSDNTATIGLSVPSTWCSDNGMYVGSWAAGTNDTLFTLDDNNGFKVGGGYVHDYAANKNILKFVTPEIAYNKTYAQNLKNYDLQITSSHALFSKHWGYKTSGNINMWSTAINTHNYGTSDNVDRFELLTFRNQFTPEYSMQSTDGIYLYNRSTLGGPFYNPSAGTYGDNRYDYLGGTFLNSGCVLKLYNQVTSGLLQYSMTKDVTKNITADINVKTDISNVVASNDLGWDNFKNYFDSSVSIGNRAVTNVNKIDFYGYWHYYEYNNLYNEPNFTVQGWSISPEDTVMYLNTTDDYVTSIPTFNNIYNTKIDKSYNSIGLPSSINLYNLSGSTNAYYDLTTTSTYLVNLKQKTTPYGGYGFTNRALSEYESVGYIVVSNNKANIDLYNGDTYISLYNHAYNRRFYNSDEYLDDANPRAHLAFLRKFINLIIPVETSINISLTQGLEYNRDENLNTQLDISDIPKIGTQDKPKYIYNTAYSLDSNATVGTVKSIYDIANRHIDNRIHYSLSKINDEVIDTWSKFTFANYLDLDSRYGSINNLKLFKNQLLSFQNNGIALLSVKERSLITDGNNAKLVLGTGDILDRFDYISTFYGMKDNHINAIEFNDQMLTFYDGLRNEILAYGGDITSLSKIKKVQSYLNTNISNIITNPSILYDKKYNEFIYTLTSDKSLIYNAFLNNFTGFFTINSDNLLYNNTNILTIKDRLLYNYRNDSTRNNLLAKVNFIVNDIPTDTKVFDNVEFISDIPTTPMKVQFITDQQLSNIITNANIRCKESTYYFAIPRVVMDSDFPDRMRGNTIQCNYTFDKSINQFHIPYIKTKYRISRS